MKIKPRAARVNKELSRVDASALLGIKESTLKRIEQGKAAATVPLGYKMAEVYGIMLDNIDFSKND